MHRFIQLITSVKLMVCLLSCLLVAWLGFWFYQNHWGLKQQILGTWQYQVTVVSDELNPLPGNPTVAIYGELTLLKSGEFSRYITLREGTESDAPLIAKVSIRGQWQLLDNAISIDFQRDKTIVPDEKWQPHSHQIEELFRFFSSLNFYIVEVNEQQLIIRSENGWLNVMTRN